MGDDENTRILGEINKLLIQCSGDREIFADKVEHLASKYGDYVYPQLIFITAHLEFSKRTAKNHLQEILRHWEFMQKKLKRDIDFRVALLDYFVGVNRKIKNPKIIEIQIFQKTQQETFVDELTQLYNYRYFARALKAEVLRSHRYNAPLSLVVCDVDDFKFYNDVNGHFAGNSALNKLAVIIKKSVRDVDIATRYGGEEFALILPETNKEGAYVISERIRKSVERGKFSKGKLQPLKRFSISGGVATLDVDADTAEELIKKADQALYIAKSRGKNQTALFEQERRDCERVNTSIIGRFRLATSVGDIFEVRNISESGVLFNYPKGFTIGNILQLSLTLPNRKTPLTCKAKLMRSKEITKNKEYELGARFLSIRDPDKKALKRFLRSIG